MMSPGAITTALDMHGVRNFTTRDGVIMAFESATRKLADGSVVDASEWIKAPTTRRAMLDWLGY